MRTVRPLGMPRARRYWDDPLAGNDEGGTPPDTTPGVNKPLCALSGILADDDRGTAAVQGNDAAQEPTA